MKMIARCFVFTVTFALLGTWTARAEASLPDFKEVQQVIREHLAGASDETVNRAAIEGLLQALNGRAVLVTNSEAATTNAGPIVARQSVFDDEVAYLRISRVDEGLASAVGTAVKNLGATNRLGGLILDLRFTDGDDYAAAAATVDLFLKSEAPLLNAGQGLVRSQEKTNALSLPVVALVNGETGEAAEALGAMLRQTGAGLLIGSRTAGRAGVRSDFKLSNGQRLRVVTAPVLLGDAKPVPATGVAPDIEVTVKPDDEKNFYADSFAATKPAPTTNSAASTRPKRVRVTEADLVREKRGDGDFDSITNARVRAEPEIQVVQDPALARAIDLLKGLALVRQTKL